MSIKKTGGSAFPYEYFDHQLSRTRTMAGMTMRDYFAAKAMEGILAGNVPITKEPEPLPLIAKAAYDMADSMLEAREE
jgi:hypothetical protein